MSYIAIERIRHNGIEFEPGDAVTGLREKEAERLLSLGVVEAGEGAEPEVFLGLEEFTVLKAEEQKEYLEEIGIQPGSNAADRLKQFEDWLKKEEK